MIFNPNLQRSLAGGSDTIVALGTPSGRGALAVVRLTGEAAFKIAERHITPWPLKAREAQLCEIHDGDRMLDHAVVTTYMGPQSFTGEDIVEISTHGGNVVSASVMSALISSGAREALPGEFTRRAVLNGKLDIVQAEATGDLVDAQSAAMQQTALNQLEGGLSSRIAALRSGVINVESLIAYDIDFPEEDDGPIPRERILQAVDDVLGKLDLLLSTIPVGQIVREGAVVVIAGEPNAGKSSLFNALLGEQRAIVTEIPGTTRDAIEGLINAGKWPMRLIDTAGLRESGDIIERMGIETSERYIAHAHLVLVCGENMRSLDRTLLALGKMKNPAPVIAILTKCDLASEAGNGDRGNERQPDVRVSAATGEGLGRLQSEMEAIIDRAYGELIPDVPILTKARHVEGIRYAREEVGKFRTEWARGTLPAPVAALHLRAAVVTLEGLIGAVSTDDVLDRLFSSFCVGK